MGILREIYDHIGCKIKLTVKDGIFEGDVERISPSLRMVVMINAFQITRTNERKDLGYLQFFEKEMISFDVISCFKKSTVKTTKDIMLEEYKTRKYINEFPDAEEYVLELPNQFKDILPHDYVIFEQVSEEFHLAIMHIHGQKVVGVSFEGERLDRKGEIIWVNVSTQFCTFLFNIHSLGQLAFTKGLKQILESEKIVKVIHNSRQASDGLYHLHEVILRRVFDTQVGDKFADLQNSKVGRATKHVLDLRKCLVLHLGLKLKDIPLAIPEHWDCAFYDGYSNWKLYPLENDLIDVAIKNVIYLRLLREKQIECLLETVYTGSDIYLEVIRNSTDKELFFEPPNPDHLPQQLMGLKTFVIDKYHSPEEIVDIINKSGNFTPLHKDVIGSYNEPREIRIPKDERIPDSEMKADKDLLNMSTLRLSDEEDEGAYMESPSSNSTNKMSEDEFKWPSFEQMQPAATNNIKNVYVPAGFDMSAKQKS